MTPEQLIALANGYYAVYEPFLLLFVLALDGLLLTSGIIVAVYRRVNYVHPV